ncbi:MAG: AAA family ATPase [Candidatus Limnocylindria bacterium]
MLERKLVTIVFADLVGSTSLASAGDPEQLREIMSRYRDAVRAEVARFGGTMEKFIGDAAMAIFGFPQAHDDDAGRALRAAFAIHDAVARLEGGALAVRIGITTGDVVADAAAGERGDFLVTGEPVHVAQRLQAAAQPGEIIVGERTWRSTRDVADFERLPPLALKGLPDLVTAYRAASLSGPRAAAAPPPFVGRSRELALLELLYEKVCAERRPHLVTLIGPPGIGKTRVAEAFRERVAAREPQTMVRAGACKPYAEAHLYCPVATIVARELTPELDYAAEPAPFLELLVGSFRRLCDDCGRPELPVDRLARLIASCVREDCAIDPPPRREELFRAWRFPLEVRGARGPAVISFDNVQWSSDEPLDFIEMLPSKLPGLPVLVIAIARPELLERRPRWGGGSGDATTLHLAPLADGDVRALVEGVLGTPPDATLASALTTRAEGNPQFLIECSRILDEDDALVRRDGQAMLREGGASLRLPDTVHGITAARIDRLPPLEKRLLLLASYACYFRFFYDRPIRAMGDLSDAEIDAALEGLVAKGLISEMEGPAGIPGMFGYASDCRAFAFSQILLREVAHEMVPKTQRPRLYLAFVDWLEELLTAMPHNAQVLRQIAATNCYQAWSLLAERGQAGPAIAQRALDYCLFSGEVDAACQAPREAAEDLRRAVEIARVSLPEREAAIRARLAELERTPVEAA